MDVNWLLRVAGLRSNNLLAEIRQPVPVFVPDDFFAHNASMRSDGAMVFPHCSNWVQPVSTNPIPAPGPYARERHFQFFAYAQPTNWAPVRAMIPGGELKNSNFIPLNQITMFESAPYIVNIGGIDYSLLITRIDAKCDVLGGASLNVEP